MTDNYDFGDRLARVMGSQRKSQVKLAHEIGISNKTVSQYITGGAKPSFEVLSKMADVLNVSVDYLLGRVDEPNAILPESDDEVTAEEMKLIRRAYQKITPRDRKTLLLIAKSLLENAEKEEDA